MKLNMHIIAEELDVPLVYSHYDDSLELSISNYRILNENSDVLLEEDMMYVLPLRLFEAVGRRYRGMNLIVVSEDSDEKKETGTGWRHNIIFVDEKTTPMRELVNSIQQIFYRYIVWNEALMDACLKRTSLQTLFEIVSEPLENPLILLDRNFSLLLTAGKIPEYTENVFWNKVVSQKYFSVDRDHLMSKVDQLGNLIERGGTVVIHDHKYGSISCSVVFCNGILYGEIDMAQINAPLSLGQLSLIEHGRKIMERYLALTGEMVFYNRDSTFVITELLKGEHVETPVLVRQLEQRKWKLSDPFYVLVLYSEENEKLTNIFNLLKVEFQRIYVKGVFSIMADKIVVILREEDYPYFINSSFNRLTAFLGTMGLKCGISQVFTGFDSLFIYYRQALAAILLGIRKNPEQIVFHYEDYCMAHISHILSKDQPWEIFCDPRVIKLEKYDRKHRSDLVNSLYEYLNAKCSVQEAATHLEIHRNTLNQRLAQIEKTAGIDIISEKKTGQIFISCLLILNRDRNNESAAQSPD